MWALDALGLADDADERDIKRAYAKQLKVTRPDEDPEGFQRLHDAYRYALEYARERAWRDDSEIEVSTEASADVEEAASVEAMASAEVSSGLEASSEFVAAAIALDTALASVDAEEEDDALDLPAFLDQCIAHLANDEPTTLREWLQSQPALWSLQMKPHIGRWLLQALDERGSPVSSDNFDVMLKFFDLDHVLSGVDPWFLQSLGHRLQLRHELQPGHERELGNRIAADTPLHERLDLMRRAMKQLRKPFSWPDALWFGLPYGRASQMHRLLWNLGGDHVEHFGDVIDVPQAKFWLDAGDTSRMSTPRRALVMARCVALVWIVGLVALAVRWLVADIATDERGTEAMQALMLLAGGPLAAYALWECWVAIRAYIGWQCAPEGADVRRPMLRLFWVPLLAFVAVLVNSMEFATVAGVLALAACITGLLRLGRRANFTFSFAGWRLLFVLPFLKGATGLIVAGLLSPYASAIAAAIVWLIDALRHTRAIRDAMRMRFRRPVADSGT